MNFEDMPDRERVSASAALRVDPSHPGLDFREGCIGPHAGRHGGARTVSEAAARLGVEPKMLAQVVSGRCEVTPDLALRLEAAGWGSARVWVELQARYDLAQERKRLAATVAGPSADTHRTMPARPPDIAARGS